MAHLNQPQWLYFHCSHLLALVIGKLEVFEAAWLTMAITIGTPAKAY